MTGQRIAAAAVIAVAISSSLESSHGFVSPMAMAPSNRYSCNARTVGPQSPITGSDGISCRRSQLSATSLSKQQDTSSISTLVTDLSKSLSNIASIALLSTALLFHPSPAMAENELAAKYGNGKSFDSSLVDQTCLVDKCSLQAKACLQDDPDCRKGLTCTAKCMGDNTCITGCMARYGDENLDNLLKCTVEDHECIKIAILEGGADVYGQEPRPPAPTVRDFDVRSMEGTWFKVAGYNPNYDCYACQRNTFSASAAKDELQVDVEFSMPRMLPDGSPPPPSQTRESTLNGLQSIAYNDYATHETMVFDTPASASKNVFTLGGKGAGAQERTFARTAHSEGEMFGLKFWENWYVIGENDPDQTEFKFVFYNGKTRQNTYEGAFVYSRSRELSPESMQKVYQIASDAGMNPDGFCKIQNGCFKDAINEESIPNGVGIPSDPVFRRLIASTRISQLLGVEPVAAEGGVLKRLTSSSTTAATSKSTAIPEGSDGNKRAWWYEVGDYLENPNRHFELMDSLRETMDWPQEVKTK